VRALTDPSLEPVHGTHCTNEVSCAAGPDWLSPETKSPFSLATEGAQIEIRSMEASLQSRKTSRGAIKPFADAELIFYQHGHGEAEIRRIELQCQSFSYDSCKSPAQECSFKSSPEGTRTVAGGPSEASDHRTTGR
jgi:hypothetical protein